MKLIITYLFLILSTTVNAKIIVIETSYDTYRIDDINNTISHFDNLSNKVDTEKYKIIEGGYVRDDVFLMRCQKANQIFIFLINESEKKIAIYNIRMPKLFKTDRGDINYDEHKGRILDQAPTYFRSQGMPEEYIPEANAYLGKLSDAIEKGDISELTSQKTLRGSGNNSLRDFGGYKQGTTGSSFLGTQKLKWDRDAAQMHATNYMIDSLSTASIIYSIEEFIANSQNWKLVIQSDIKSIYEQ